MKHEAALTHWSQECECSLRDAALEALYEFYEAAGFDAECLDAEFGCMTDDELFKAFDDMIPD